MHKKRWETEESIEQLFMQSLDNIEVNSELNRLQKRRFDSNLAKDLDERLNLLLSDKKKSNGSVSSKIKIPSKKLKNSLTERLHRGT